MELHSVADNLLVGVPMVLVLMAVFFRLDEVFTRRPNVQVHRPLAGGVDRNGMPICTDPEGKPFGRTLSDQEVKVRGRSRVA
jgi:hypothetical protein